jgi:hypothetical protein
MIRTDSSWSGFPHSPNIIAPRQSGVTFMPVRPSVLWFIVRAPVRAARRDGG